METKHLKTFATIVDTGSFTRAGQRLRLSQSAISQQVRALEQKLGTRLLLRTANGVRPTHAGTILLDYARQILRKVEEAQRMLTHNDARGAGVLRIGAGSAFSERLLPPLVRNLRERFPQLEIRISSAHSRQTVRQLLDGDLEVGFVTLPEEEPSLPVTEIARDELIAIVPPAHPLAAHRRVQIDALANESFLVQDLTGKTFDRVERLLLEAGRPPRIAMQLDTVGGVASMVAAGLGVAVVPRWAVHADIAAGRLCGLSIGKSGLFRTWGVARNADPGTPEVLKAFIRQCEADLPAAMAVD